MNKKRIYSIIFSTRYDHADVALQPEYSAFSAIIKEINEKINK